MAGNGKDPKGGGGERVSRTNYLDKSIFVGIANIQIIAFASIFFTFCAFYIDQETYFILLKI